MDKKIKKIAVISSSTLINFTILQSLCCDMGENNETNLKPYVTENHIC